MSGLFNESVYNMLPTATDEAVLELAIRESINEVGTPNPCAEALCNDQDAVQQLKDNIRDLRADEAKMEVVEKFVEKAIDVFNNVVSHDEDARKAIRSLEESMIYDATNCPESLLDKYPIFRFLVTAGEMTLDELVGKILTSPSSVQ